VRVPHTLCGQAGDRRTKLAFPGKIEVVEQADGLTYISILEGKVRRE